MSQEQRSKEPSRLSRRAALQAGAALGAAGAAMAAGPATGALAAQGGWRTEHLEYDFVGLRPISITLAGSGPAQQGDTYSNTGPITAVGDVGGVQLGTYHCFGAWTAASTDTTVAYRRLTTVQFNLGERGSLFGVINEDTPSGADLIGVIQGGTGRYAGAQGTFRQIPNAPAPGLRAVIDIIVPGQG